MLSQITTLNSKLTHIDSDTPHGVVVSFVLAAVVGQG